MTHPRKRKSRKNLRIADWYVHQGHQYEFFKLPHTFFLIGADGNRPKWNQKHRPKNKNSIFITEKRALTSKYDAVMVRSPIHMRRYRNFIKKGAVPIAVVQTTDPFDIPVQVKHVVWNSYEVMKAHRASMPDKKHYYIVHGYDPNEFVKIDMEKNGRILTVANVFKGRGDIMGFPLWKQMNKNFKRCDIIGHSNEDIKQDIREADSLDELLTIYNTYSIYLNTTKHSAMPRSRAEAAMCGMPIVSTKNYDIARYFTHKKNAIITNDRYEMQAGIKMLLESEAMREDFGEAAREIAIKHFHIDEYLDKWEQVLRSV